MSFSRILLIGFLVIALCGTLAVGGFVIYQRFPGYRMAQAEKAIAAEDYESAHIHLRKLLKKDPTNVDAKLMLVDVIRDYSEKEGRSRSYLANPTALEQLAEAAELRPNDLELQKRLLAVYLVIRDLGKAAVIAEEVYKDEPTNADAHFALTWKAVQQKQHARAEQLFKQFNDNEILTRRIFQTLALQIQFYWEREEKDTTAEILATVEEKTLLLKDDELGVLLNSDRQKMLELLLVHQQMAEEPKEALDRAKVTIDVANRLAVQELMDERILANAAAQSIALFNMKFPAIELEQAHITLRDQLSQAAENLGSDALAIAKEADATAPLLVYWNTARTLMTRGKFDEAIATLEDGIAASEKLPEQYRNQALDLHLLAARVLIMQRKFNAANEHLDKLMGNQRFEGWGHLLKGSVALHQGRTDLAHQEFLGAKASMGDKILVRMSLAHTHMARKEWAEAIPILKSLDVPEDQLTDEEKAWYRQLLGGGDRVQFDMLRARLAQGNWDDAQENLRRLRETDLAPNAWGVAITYLWEEEDDKPKARKYMDLVRDKYKDNLALALLDARMLKENGESVAASRMLQQFAAAKPDDELRQLALARWQIRNKEPQQALATLTSVEQLSLSTKAKNTVDVYRVQALIGAQQYDQAAEKADQLIANKGTATAGYLMKAALAFRERDETTGVAMLEAARDANPENPALNMMISRIRGAQGDFDGVIELASGVAGIDKYEAQVQTTVGDALRHIAQTEGSAVALKKADELLAKSPDDLSLIVLKVDLQLSLKKYNDAMTVLNDVQRKRPNDINIPRLKAQAWMAQGEFDAALNEIKRAMEMEVEQEVVEKDVNLMLMAAQAAIGAEQYQIAAQYGDMARRASPDSARGYLLMAEGFRKQGEISKAVVVLEAYARRKPNDFAIHKTLADLYNESGQTEKAIAWMERARANQPNDMRYTIGQLEMMLETNRKGEAQLLARDVIGKSQSVRQTLAVAQVFAEHGENLDAQTWGEKALELATTTEQPAVHSFLGRIYLRRAGQEQNDAFYEKASTHFKIVLESQPRDIVAGNNLAWLLATKFNNADEAVRVAESVRGDNQVKNLPPAFIDTMIDVYNRSGQQAKARSLAKEAVGHFPREAPLLYRYGLLLLGTEPVQAKQMLQRAVELGLPAADEAEARRKLARL